MDHRHTYKSKTIKLLKVNIRENLRDLSEDFLDMTPKHNSEKINENGLHQN